MNIMKGQSGRARIFWWKHGRRLGLPAPGQPGSDVTPLCRGDVDGLNSRNWPQFQPCEHGICGVRGFPRFLQEAPLQVLLLTAGARSL